MSAVIKGMVITVVLILLSALAFQTYTVHKQRERLNEAVAQVKTLNESVARANESIKTQKVMSDVTDKVVTSATERITTNTIQGTAIQAVVDNVTKRVANGTISNSVASVVYVDRMWDAYCQASPGDSDCTTRQSSHKLSNR
jgi:hypothetical protein